MRRGLTEGTPGAFVEEMGEMIAASVLLYGAWRLVGPVATGTYR